MVDFVWATFVRLQAIASLPLFNLTADKLVKLTDFNGIEDLVAMGLMDIEDGRLVVYAHFTPELAEYVCDELMHLSMDRENGKPFARVPRLLGRAVYIPEGATLH